MNPHSGLGRRAGRAALGAAIAAAAVLSAADAGTGAAREPRTGESGQSRFTNTPQRATGITPSGVRVTVEKIPARGAYVASAQTLPADPAAPPDEYMLPANAKAVAGFSDRYEGFGVAADGWSHVATLRFSFSQPVRNPRLHISGTGGATANDDGARDAYWAGLRLSGGTPATPTFTKSAGFPGYTVSSTRIMPGRSLPAGRPACGVVYLCGSAQVDGTVTSFTVELHTRNVRYNGGAGAPFFYGAFRVTLEEDHSDAPASYGAASHTVTDAFLGGGATADQPGSVAFTPRALPRDTDDALARTPAPIRIRSQRGRHWLTVPVATRSATVLSGWLDLDRDGVFEPGERARNPLPAKATRATLSWPIPPGTRPGASWLRLRLATPGQAETPTGWADSGEVEDHPVLISGPAHGR
ncbi:hypothetical protein HNP84_003105 [Thermocatellispora tengchongensis]|uniref:GEVED domain-containing protein n=1 Tax=Thermocatellispora tengchongensis TaxID=1073253 RepID=A0A840P319_9ACTN|nr:GEVED domain-containing protein [Thermocatellispora tengchongensis]MBB5133379.1 hypothetical protein [Thermocatellispora tengchongensis]